MKLVATLVMACAAAQAATQLTVTVMDPKTGRFIADLKTEDFAVTDDKSPRGVEKAELASGPMDIMLLLDTSLVGGAVQPVASNLIAQLESQDQMAVVAFHSSADLIQEFTASRELLTRAIARVKYGNTPRLLDALYAAIDGGFENTTFRRVLLILTTGFEGGSRVSEREVLRLARKNGVSISTVYMTGRERGLFEALARQTGGASFSLRDLGQAGRQPGPRIFDTLRRSYVLTLAGNPALGEKVKVEVRRPQKLFVSALPQE